MWHTVNPEEQGFSSERLQRIGVLMQEYVRDMKLCGMSATIARCGQTVYLDKFGMADMASGRPIEFDTIFRIMSMSKPITSVGIMMLYEEGRFDINTPVSEFLPAWKDMQVFVRMGSAGPELEPLRQQMTMRHLFTHSSGLSYGNRPDDPVDMLYGGAFMQMRAAGVALSNKSLVKYLPQTPLAFQPGSSYRYGLSIDVLGAIVEVITGKSLGDYLRERIFEPLGMTDTGFWIPEQKAGRLATVYTAAPEGAGLTPVELKPPFEAPSFESGGGGLLSTLGDYARFAQMLVNGGALDGVRLLSPSTVALMELNHLPIGLIPEPNHAGYGYSLGMRVLVDVAASGQAGSVGEFGWDGAYTTYFWIDRKHQLYGLLMLHQQGCQIPVKKRFKALTYQAMVG